MKNYIAAISTGLAAFLLIIVASLDVSAQQTFLLKSASQKYDVKLQVAKCEDDICEGAATVEVFAKAAAQPMQTIKMPNIYLELGSDQKPTANLIELYGENNSGVIFDDFNFDGIEDLALRNGNEGAYGGPSYDVFLSSATTKKFTKNVALTKLASENLGMFEINKEKKTIETFTKSGCCWHQTTRYKIANNRPVKIYVLTEDDTGDNDQTLVTTETLVAGKWKKTVKRVKRG